MVAFTAAGDAHPKTFRSQEVSEQLWMRLRQNVQRWEGETEMCDDVSAVECAPFPDKLPAHF